MNRIATWISGAGLVLGASMAGAYLSGVPRVAAVLGLLALGSVLVARLYSPIEVLERSVRRMIAGDPKAMSRLDLPDDVQPLADVVSTAVRTAGVGMEDLAAKLGDLNELLDRMEEGVVAVHEEGRLHVANRAARDILGLKTEYGPSPRVSRIRSAELRAVLDAALQTTIRPRSIHVGDREVLVESHPVDGGAIVSLRDVTDMRRLEQVRTDFVANASHELKTPLTAVRGFAETLLDDPDAPPEIRRQFLGLIFENTIRLQHIVEDLLDLSRLESGGWTPEVEAVQVAKVARESWLTVQEGREANRSFEVHGEGRVWADRPGLHHIFRNLLDNAVRHTAPDGTIEVEVSPADGFVTIEVTDDGVGIPPDALPRVFERFFRVDKARSRAQGGTGLGLAIVSHLVSRMGGELSAESQFGVGTTIRMKLKEAVPGSDVPKFEA